MSSRRNRRGNRRLKLEKAKQEMKILETELETLNKAEEAQGVAEKIRDSIINNGTDPMLLEENNPFKARDGGCCKCMGCEVL